MTKYIALVCALLVLVGAFWLASDRMQPRLESPGSMINRDAAHVDNDASSAANPIISKLAPQTDTKPALSAAESLIESSSDVSRFGIFAGHAPQDTNFGYGGFGGFIGDFGEVDLNDKIIPGAVVSIKDRNPIANAEIKVEGTDVCRTPDDGAFHWKCLGRESISITVSHPDYYSLTETLSADSGYMEIQMIPVGALAGANRRFE
ncbi:hypothetical protein K8I31_13370 [bacterium]|nr:hypothetical protein [bacterium]